jgi:hypothetical protein
MVRAITQPGMPAGAAAEQDPRPMPIGRGGRQLRAQRLTQALGVLGVLGHAYTSAATLCCRDCSVCVAIRDHIKVFQFWYSIPGIPSLVFHPWQPWGSALRRRSVERLTSLRVSLRAAVGTDERENYCNEAVQCTFYPAL